MDVTTVSTPHTTSQEDSGIDFVEAEWYWKMGGALGIGVIVIVVCIVYWAERMKHCCGTNTETTGKDNVVDSSDPPPPYESLNIIASGKTCQMQFTSETGAECVWSDEVTPPTYEVAVQSVCTSPPPPDYTSMSEA